MTFKQIYDEPAFPVADQNHTGGLIGCYGMGLRDYFAAKALQALIAKDDREHKGKHSPKPLAIYAYEYADAMLSERTNDTFQ